MEGLEALHLVADHQVPYITKAYQDLGYIPVFIDAAGSSTDWAGATVDAQPINAEAVQFVEDVIARLDATLAIDFRVSTTHAEPGAVRILKHASTEAYPADARHASGYASFSYQWTYYSEDPATIIAVEVVFNDVSVNTIYGDDDTNFWRHVVVHELGHSLLLEHPFDGTDGDAFGSKQSPSVDDSVMAYGSPAQGVYPEWFTALDLEALVGLWGAESMPPPAPPALLLALDSGESSSDRITNDGTLLVEGLVSDGVWEYSLDAGQSWQLGSGSRVVVPQGSYNTGDLQVRQSDRSGLTSEANAALAAVVVDQTAPQPLLKAVGRGLQLSAAPRGTEAQSLMNL